MILANVTVGTSICVGGCAVTGQPVKGADDEVTNPALAMVNSGVSRFSGRSIVTTPLEFTADVKVAPLLSLTVTTAPATLPPGELCTVNFTGTSAGTRLTFAFSMVLLLVLLTVPSDRV